MTQGKLSCEQISIHLSGAVRWKNFQQIGDALRKAAELCEEQVSGPLEQEASIEGLGRVIATIFESGGAGGRSIHSWFAELEKQTLRQLVSNGATLEDIAKYLGNKKKHTAYVHLNTRGISIARDGPKE